MPQVKKLTAQRISALNTPIDSDQIIYWEDKTPGFGIRVTKSGVKSYIAEGKVKGKTRRTTIERCSKISIPDARDLATEFFTKLKQGIDPRDEKAIEKARGVTLEDVFDDYIKERTATKIEKPLKPTTIADYKRAFKEGLSLWEKTPITQITSSKIRKQYKTRSHTPLRARIENDLLSTLFNFAIGYYTTPDDKPIIESNPAAKAIDPKNKYKRERRQTVIKPEDLSAWYQAVESLRTDDPNSHGSIVADYMLTQILTGLRPTECATLLKENVDIGDKTFTVIDPKNGDDHTLPLPSFLLKILKRRVKSSLNEYVFSNPAGTTHLKYPRDHNTLIVNRSGIQFMLTDLRRVFTTTAESLNISAYSVKALINHRLTPSKGDVTTGYIVLDTERLRQPMKMINDFITNKMISSGNSITYIKNENLVR